MKNFIFFVLLISLLNACSRKNTSYILLIESLRDNKHQSLIEGDGAPLLESELALLQYFPINKNYQCICSVEEFEKNKVIEMPTYAGTTTSYQIYGKAICTLNKDTLQMNLYQPVLSAPIYRGRIFLPFKDITNGESTYGGGRYIDLLEKDIVDGKITIDFNTSYNPLCAYKDGYRCPIPPRENHFTIAINAGEKNFVK
jgi:uncharacterized protein (DUF1684 family)